ncbi:hypothetical protein HPB50_020890 [Hyalomma asiaticum]|uniref:Uncharacterized protein n=1 Tax=Hyalomma asiaticum TaxID=266040 RepID=A0ACB7T8K4_HYAAI|nr:hypothetical protein HPB50_020890 [Hyalomma asiaticum]
MPLRRESPPPRQHYARLVISPECLREKQDNELQPGRRSQRPRRTTPSAKRGDEDRPPISRARLDDEGGPASKKASGKEAASSQVVSPLVSVHLKSNTDW